MDRTDHACILFGAQHREEKRRASDGTLVGVIAPIIQRFAITAITALPAGGCRNNSTRNSESLFLSARGRAWLQPSYYWASGLLFLAVAQFESFRQVPRPARPCL